MKNRNLYATADFDKDTDPQGYELAAHRANIQYGFMQFITAVSFVSCLILLFLVYRRSQRRLTTPYDTVVFVTALFQGIDQFSYFFNYSPTSREWTQDDDRVYNLTYSYMWIHRFSHVVSLGGDSLLGASIMYIFLWGKSPRIDKIIAPWFAFYVVVGIIFASAILGFQMHYRTMQTGSEERLSKYYSYIRSIQAYNVFSYVNVLFEMFVVVLSFSMIAMHRRSSHSSVMSELVRRFTLYPLASVFTQLPYLWYVFSPRYERDDEFRWNEADRALDGLYYCVPQTMGFLMLLIYILTKRIDIGASIIVHDIYRRATTVFPFLLQRQLGEDIDEEPHEFAALPDEELMSLYVEHTKSMKRPQMSPNEQPKANEQPTANKVPQSNEQKMEEHLPRPSSVFIVGNPLRLRASELDPAADVEMVEHAEQVCVDEVPAPSSS
jgi:hypothetical protein